MNLIDNYVNSENKEKKSLNSKVSREIYLGPHKTSAFTSNSLKLLHN